MRVTILGAGGNMGRRITRSLTGLPQYELRYVEPSEAGRRKMADELGVEATDVNEAVRGADIVIFAVPDAIVKDVAAETIPTLASGTSILFLDPAAIVAGRVTPRGDVNCFVTHPTHPPLYSLLDEEDAAARRDYWGGGLARQAIVFATAWGDEATADDVEKLSADMFAPVTCSHRITIEQMATLEPALSETVVNGCIDLIREAMERVIATGVPEAATRDFLMGHLQISIALFFDQMDWKLSAAAAAALTKARASLFRDDWYHVFDRESILASVREITGGD